MFPVLVWLWRYERMFGAAFGGPTRRTSTSLAWSRLDYSEQREGVGSVVANGQVIDAPSLWLSPHG